MRFAALGGSNTSDYVAAGRAVADSAAKTFAVQRKTGPDYGKLSQMAMKTQAEENVAGMAAASKVTRAGIKAYEGTVKQGNRIEVFNKGQEIKSSQKMAGGIAAIGKMAGVGYLASKDNTKGRERPKGDRTSIIDSFKASNKASNERYDDATATLGPYKSTVAGSSTPKKVTGASAPTTPSSVAPIGGSLTGNQRTVADAIAKYESGDWGYEAFNQGGAAGGTKVLGKSGSHQTTFGRSLTDMTLGEIYHKQNTAQRGLSMSEHISSGGLHAVGRYQFIGPTLQAEAKRMGLSPDTKFTPQVQDNIFLNHIKRVGDISPWVGPTNNYSASQKQDFRNMIAGF